MTTIEQLPGYGPPTPVPILQWAREFTVLLEVYRRLKPKRVLEVGTYHGGTLYHWLQNARAGTMIVSLDSYVTGVDNRHLYDEWAPPKVALEVLEADSHASATVETVKALGPYDWLFIDAGHYLSEVTQDWNLYRPLVKKGGIACLHDILLHKAHPEIEVAHLWAQIKQEHLTFEIVDNPKAEWGGIGVALL
jgi:predicted O-methyltransferase YrrM